MYSVMTNRSVTPETNPLMECNQVRLTLMNNIVLDRVLLKHYRPSDIENRYILFNRVHTVRL